MKFALVAPFIISVFMVVTTIWLTRLYDSPGYFTTYSSGVLGWLSFIATLQWLKTFKKEE